MGLDEEIRKAKEELKKNPPLSREDYERAKAWLRERLGEKGFEEFMNESGKDVDILNRYVDILNKYGVGSGAEKDFLKEYENDPVIFRLLRTARKMKNLYSRP